jgi:hypothetical protein
MNWPTRAAWWFLSFVAAGIIVFLALGYFMGLSGEDLMSDQISGGH